MNKHASNFQTQIIDQARALVSTSLAGIELFRALNGVHPIELKKALTLAGEEILLEKVFGNLSISNGVLKEITQDDNPILSFWPFTRECANEISENIPSHDSVALLGVPTIFSALRERSFGRAILFDSDDYLFRGKVTTNYVQCDVLSGITSQYENQFDTVVGDPPWYVDEYCDWLRVAVGLARPGGTVIFVLFPPNIRDTSGTERSRILAIARKLLLDVQIMPISASYSTPSFEQVELIRNGIAPVNWRTAHFFAGKVPANKDRFVSETKTQRAEHWIERRVGCGRVFVKNEPLGSSHFLEPASPNGRFLSSPSRRDPARNRSNVVSSRGHGLCCNDPKLLLDLLGRIRCASDIEAISRQLDKTSASLLEAVGNDLWPRFIEVQVAETVSAHLNSI